MTPDFIDQLSAVIKAYRGSFSCKHSQEKNSSPKPISVIEQKLSIQSKSIRG